MDGNKNTMLFCKVVMPVCVNKQNVNVVFYSYVTYLYHHNENTGVMDSAITVSISCWDSAH